MVSPSPLSPFALPYPLPHSLIPFTSGGLLIDLSLLLPNIPSLLTSFSLPIPSPLPSLLEIPPLDPSHSAVVEMRAVTVIMLDRIAEGIRKKTGDEGLTLAQCLEAGTWKAVSCFSSSSCLFEFAEKREGS